MHRHHPIAPPRRKSRFPSATTLALIVGVLGLGAVWLLVEPPAGLPRPAPPAPQTGLIGPGPADRPAPPSVPASAPIATAEPDAAARPVAGGEAILPAPEIRGPLVRAEPPARPPPPEKPPEPVAFARVQVDAPGRIRAARQTIVLAGIRPPDLDKVCTDPDGRLWPCGVQARSALRAFIGARRVTCTQPVPLPDGRPDEAVASCAIGPHDLSEWLVQQGWAEPAGDAPENFAGLADEARTARLGIWQSAPALHAPIVPARTMPEAIGTPLPVGGSPLETPPAPAPPDQEPGDGPPVNLISPAR